jgi:hypothetical protein
MHYHARTLEGQLKLQLHTWPIAFDSTGGLGFRVSGLTMAMVLKEEGGWL